MYYVDGDILEIILLQKTINEDGHFWILCPGSLRVLGVSDTHVQSSTTVLTNISCMSTVKLPLLFHVKFEPTENSIFLLSDADDDVCPTVDLFETSSYPFEKTITSTPPSLLPPYGDNTPLSLPCKNLFFK